MTHTIKARQRNDKELAAVDNRIEILEVELNDLHATRRALLAMAQALRGKE